MIVFPNCKINLGLTITRKREDGFHDLETVFYPIAIKDALEITQQPDANTPTTFTQSGITIEGNADDNLCLKAYHLLKKDFPHLPNIQLHLHKVIPMGAGLGGGSSDGAFTLKLLNQKFQLGLSVEQLIDYALQLGSDCPFFIINQPCFATGRGEFLQKITIDLSAYRFVIVNPGIHVNTGWAFSQLQLKPVSDILKMSDTLLQPVESWKDVLINDFEKPVFEKHPEIKNIKDKLYEAGAVYASMSGSGSTVYGLFTAKPMLENSFPAHYFVKQL
ncbi:MAG: 4-(cytidine 5'-diphospho)-2-C-methyl-D-erythritol kinase [Sphingobacteriales bacterium]|nr:4-(cytidine 5'-diphospho)-2-C-methyl-D-erythritol kinase [Sphingobacteriales bacterium]MBI3719660.1 4-(cytidine 5'-diphospho)-2-C-methyl-D-erythritol kinase [Sphingobacteriales bacterium]